LFEIAPFALQRVYGTELNRRRIDEMLGRSLMLVTAFSPVIGHDKTSAIAHKASDEGLTLKEAALKSGYIDEKRFDVIVDPHRMVGHGVLPVPETSYGTETGP
jgi:fumarate hydratase, class II